MAAVGHDGERRLRQCLAHPLGFHLVLWVAGDDRVRQLQAPELAGDLVWDAVCTGPAVREICGPIRPSEGARIWTATLQALLAGLGSTDQARTSR